MSADFKFTTIDDLNGILLQWFGHVAGGDVLVFRGGIPPDFQHEIIETAMHYFKQVSGKRRVEEHCPLLMFLTDDMSIERLDQDQMRRHGWVRHDAT